MLTRPINKKMTVYIEFANEEFNKFTTAKYIDLNFAERRLTFRQNGNLVYVNLNSVNYITFIEEKEAEEDASN